MVTTLTAISPDMLTEIPHVRASIHGGGAPPGAGGCETNRRREESRLDAVIKEDVEITSLRKRGWSISAIARHVGHDHKTVRSYLSGEREPVTGKSEHEDATVGISSGTACLLLDASVAQPV